MANKTNSRSRAQKQARQFEEDYRRIVPKKKGKRAKGPVVRPSAIIATCIAVLCIGCALVAGCLYVNNLNGVILDNIYVAGVDVGGMTQAQAIEAVQAATAHTYGQQSMTVRVLDSEITLPANCCQGLNVRKAVRAAYQYGNSVTDLQQHHTVDITPYLKLDEAAIREHLNKLGENYNTTLSQSTWEIQGDAPNQILFVHLGVPEYGLNLNELYETVLSAYNDNLFLAEGSCGIIPPSPVDLESIFQEHYIAPVDAVIDKNTYEITEGIDGYGFDLEKAKQTLENSAYGTTVEIPFVALSPEVTKQSLEALLYRDVLGSYTAMEESESNRDTNLRLACEAIDGIVLMPGDVFSFNDTLGKRTEAKGYRPGPSIAGGKITETIGGGICQVASALYYCTLVSDLDIIFRDCHSFATDYMPLGMDATISWGTLDFKFKNNTDYPIKITASANGGDTKVTILGTDTKDYYVKMEYETLNTYAYSTEYQTISPDNAEGYQNGDYIVEPATGYDIKTYKCKYDKQTDALISRDFEANSNYNKRDAVICRIESGQQSPSTGGNTTPGIGGGNISDNPGDLPDE